jgi:hypothetical protein
LDVIDVAGNVVGTSRAVIAAAEPWPLLGLGRRQHSDDETSARPINVRTDAPTQEPAAAATAPELKLVE